MLDQIFSKISALKNWLIAIYIMAVLLISMSAKANLNVYSPDSIVEIESTELFSGYLAIKGKSHTLCVNPLELQVTNIEVGIAANTVTVEFKPDESCMGSFIETPFHSSLDLFSASIPEGIFDLNFRDPSGQFIPIYSNVEIVPATTTSVPVIESIGYLKVGRDGQYELHSDHGVTHIYSEIIDLSAFVNRNVKVQFKESTHHVGPVLTLAADPLPSKLSTGQSAMLYFAVSIKNL